MFTLLRSIIFKWYLCDEMFSEHEKFCFCFADICTCKHVSRGQWTGDICKGGLLIKELYLIPNNHYSWSSLLLLAPQINQMPWLIWHSSRYYVSHCSTTMVCLEFKTLYITFNSPNEDLKKEKVLLFLKHSIELKTY